MEIKDFTLAQAKRWVAQEAPKYQTREAIERILAQHKMLEAMDIPGLPDLTNTRQAHADLAVILNARLETL